MTEQVFEDVACTVCACVCDDLRVTVRGGRIVDYRPFCSLIGDWFTKQDSKSFPAAMQSGVEIPYVQAVDVAAHILRDARHPLIYGLSRSSTDGQREAVALADRLGATIDTTASEGHSPSILALQQVGESTCSLGEIRNRADLVIYWGSDPIVEHPRHMERYSMRPGMQTPRGRADRTLVVVDSHRTITADQADHYLEIRGDRDFEAIWILRGLLRGIEPSPEAIGDLPIDQLRDLADRMRNCRCGIIFFGYGLVLQKLGSQNVQALLQLVTDLNQFTRFHARRMRVAGDVAGADSVLCWQTGYPFSINLAKGYPRYSPGEYSAADALERREPDAVVLIGSARLEKFPLAALQHLEQVQTILLEHSFGEVSFVPTIRITTAIHGIHRHGTAYRMDEIPIPLIPLLPSNHPSDCEVLRDIHSRIWSSQPTSEGRPMLERVLEPEVMNTSSEAIDYNQMDHSHVNRVFADDFLSALKSDTCARSDSYRIFDAGTGTALIPIELMRRQIRAVITASDLADQMLLVARKNVDAAGFSESIELVLRDCKRLPDANESYDAVMSNSIVHHIPEPQHVIAELWRILKPGGLLFVRDLMRPSDVATLEHLVATYAGDANGHQQQMFRESLHAALTVSEVRRILAETRIPAEAVNATSDRHWTIVAYKPQG